MPDSVSTVGEQLRQARESQKLTLQQVAEITKLRSDHLRALEEGHFEVFSAPIYVRGSVRSYAQVLKLDARQLLAALDAELGQSEKFREPLPLTEERRGVLDFVMLLVSKVDWRKGLAALGVVAGLVLVVSVFLIWRHYATRDPLAGLKPGVYQPTQHLSGDILPLPAPAPPR